MAFEQVLGVLAVRDIEKIHLVNPTEEKAVKFGEKLRAFGVNEEIVIDVVRDVAEAVRRADIICCSTRSTEPVFKGNDVKPGTHVNGIGSYLPHMREVDLEFINVQVKLSLMTMEGIVEEAGELIHAHSSQTGISAKFRRANGSCNRQSGCTTDDEEITFFKSVGAAYFDLSCIQRCVS